MNPTPRAVRFAAFSSLPCGALVALGSCNIFGGTTVDVTLLEFSVTPASASAPAGRVTFHVINEGDEDHEFLVIKTDLAANALPTGIDGSYLENGPGTELLDEIELIRPGASADLTLELGAGNYVLICNLVDIEDDGSVEAHYALGMFAAFAVE